LKFFFPDALFLLKAFNACRFLVISPVCSIC
jgi:hypothetical protein